MKRIIVIFMLIFVTGCLERSISNSGYNRRSRYDQFSYGADININDLLDIKSRDIKEEDISSALEEEADINIKQGSKILLIQSGAKFPDVEMSQQMRQLFDTVPFEGTMQGTNAPQLSKKIRLFAAKTGANHIICYWGVLQTLTKDMATKTISWVPVVGKIIPDEVGGTRILLKVAIIDVRTGQWVLFEVEPIEKKFISSKVGREGIDQKVILKLKEKSYTSACNVIKEKYLIKEM